MSLNLPWMRVNEKAVHTAACRMAHALAALMLQEAAWARGCIRQCGGTDT